MEAPLKKPVPLISNGVFAPVHKKRRKWRRSGNKKTQQMTKRNSREQKDTADKGYGVALASRID